MTFDVLDVAVTQFPFADRNAEKKRPALILSSRDFGAASGVALVAMITTGRASQWPLDVPVSDLDAAGLKHGCVVRMKLATVDVRRIDRTVGSLAESDRTTVSRSLSRLLPLPEAAP